MVFATIFKRGLTRNGGSFVYPYASSFISLWRLEKGESSTRPAIAGSRYACKRAVAAPIDRPHKATVETFLFVLK